jgi:hypothetical protein
MHRRFELMIKLEKKMISIIMTTMMYLLFLMTVVMKMNPVLC